MPGEALVAAAAVEAVKDAAQMTAWDHMYLAKVAADVAKTKPLVVAEQALAQESKVLADHNPGLGHRILDAVEGALGLHPNAGVAPAAEVAGSPVTPVAPASDSQPAQTPASPPASHVTAAEAIELHVASMEGHIADSLKAFAAKLRTGEESFTAEVKGELEKLGVKF